MGKSIPVQASGGNGGAGAEFGQAMLDRALEGRSGRVAVLLVEGVTLTQLAIASDEALRRSDVMSVLGDGRLAILAPHLRETGGAADLAARVLALLPPGESKTAAIGIALAPEDGTELPALLTQASAALTRASAYSSGRFAFADAERDARWRIGPLLASAIAEALAGDQFSLVFQPIARLDSRVVTGAEALLRWQRPGGESWPPSIFIPEAERRGLMEPITAWTFDAACKALARLGSAAGGFRLGVNLSAGSLGQGAREIVAANVKRYGIDPSSLMVEITETAPFIEDKAAVADVQAIAGIGCGIAIDDFGAGHASLEYVVRLPANRIKLDGKMVSLAVTDARARAAIKATVCLAADIGADVVAEGVQDQSQAAFLAEVGVELGQGALFGLPADGPLALDRPRPAP